MNKLLINKFYMRKVWFGLIAFILGLSPLQAQDDSSRRSHIPGDFDFYVLALSWSPGFCELEGNSKKREQCAEGGQKGFVVHGLWPQKERGFPSDCSAQTRFITRKDIEVAAKIFPSEGLARHQWRKHGTCSGNSPSSYFADVKAARDAIIIPQQFIDVKEEMTVSAIDVERAFAEANPGLRRDMMAVSCRKNILNEVRICFDRNLKSFKTCEELDRKGCRTRQITINASPH
jgi:ribonuclease T2